MTSITLCAVCLFSSYSCLGVCLSLHQHPHLLCLSNQAQRLFISSSPHSLSAPLWLPRSAVSEEVQRLLAPSYLFLILHSVMLNKILFQIRHGLCLVLYLRPRYQKHKWTARPHGQDCGKQVILAHKFMKSWEEPYSGHSGQVSENSSHIIVIMLNLILNINDLVTYY